MIGLHHSVISDDSEDVSDGVEVEFFTDSKAQKFKEFSDTQLDDEIEKYEGYVAGTRKAALNLPDGGNKFTKHLESLRSEKHKRARKLKRALAGMGVRVGKPSRQHSLFQPNLRTLALPSR